jgi:hypothetical protein
MLDLPMLTSGNEKPKPVKKTNVPAADIDFDNLGNTVSTKWTASPWLTIQWLTESEFAAKTANYNSILGSRMKKGGSRPQLTKAIQVVEKKIEEGVANVKNYIVEKYKKDNAKSYYASFGIVQIGKAYSLPKDQDGRSKGLELLVEAIAENGFANKQYGTVFWTAIQTEYDQLLDNALITDSAVSSNVGDKNLLKKDIKKALNAIISIIRGNYPDTYKTELRNWGFQKEKY